MLVLDSGTITWLAQRNRQSAALIAAMRDQGLWPPIVPSVTLVESLTGRPGPDANTNRLLKTCDIATDVSERTARRAAELRHLAGRGSAVDAIVIATAEPAGSVLTGDPKDLRALASHAPHVTVHTI